MRVGKVSVLMYSSLIIPESATWLMSPPPLMAEPTLPSAPASTEEIAEESVMDSGAATSGSSTSRICSVEQAKSTAAAEIAAIRRTAPETPLSPRVFMVGFNMLARIWVRSDEIGLEGERQTRAECAERGLREEVRGAEQVARRGIHLGVEARVVRPRLEVAAGERQARFASTGASGPRLGRQERERHFAQLGVIALLDVSRVRTHQVPEVGRLPPQRLRGVVRLLA